MKIKEASPGHFLTNFSYEIKFNGRVLCNVASKFLLAEEDFLRKYSVETGIAFPDLSIEYKGVTVFVEN